MATVTEFSNKKILVIDDMQEARQQLQMTLASIGFESLHIVSNIKEAIDKIEIHNYAVILCDYNLGDSTDGQQFLEYVRLNNKISSNTLFVMITAENSYEKVIAAVECLPDDYILKPFTAAHFISRFKHLIEKQQFFEKVNKAYDKKNWPLVTQECDKLLQEKNKYFTELLKIKANALEYAEMTEPASEVYQSVLEMRPLPWATLGLARTKAKLGDTFESRNLTDDLVREYPQFLAGYEFASELAIQENKTDKAMDYLTQAMEINKENLPRIRSMASMVMAQGDFESAEDLIRTSVRKHRHSPVHNAGDYALLARSLTEQGKHQEALANLKTAKKQFKDKDSHHIIAASSCIAYSKAGDQEKAAEVLDEVMTDDYQEMSNDVAISLAEACYAAGKEEMADSMLKHVLQNNPDDPKLQSKIKMAQVISGKSIEDSDDLIQTSSKEVIKINNDGVRKAQEGKYEEAMDLILNAAKKLPNNISLISNAALIVAVSAGKVYVDEETMELCFQYRNRLKELSPSHPKLEKINTLLSKLKEKQKEAA